jgi:hypothetical protein
MSLTEQSIQRIYRCTNKECETELAYKEKVGDKWRKKCPLCGKHSLLLDRANLNISTMVDTYMAKTLGSISDQNSRRKEKEEGFNKKPKPFWRNSDKINYNILKNPNQYVNKGIV